MLELQAVTNTNGMQCDVSSSASGKLFSHPKLTSRQARSICRGLDHPKGSGDRVRGPNNGSAGGRQDVLNCVCHQIAVFNNQHALAFQGGTPPNAGKVVPARHEAGSNYFCTSTHIFCNGEPKPMTMRPLEKARADVWSNRRESSYVSSDSTLRHAGALSDWLWSGLKCFGAIPIRALSMRLKSYGERRLRPFATIAPRTPIDGPPIVVVASLSLPPVLVPG